MKTLPLILATLLYLWQCWNFVSAGESGLSIVFFGYALANIGLILAAS
jgi:hypothetical protein